MIRQEQIQFAIKLCDRDKEAVKEFQKLYHPYILYIAKEKFLRRIMNPIPFSKEIVYSHLADALNKMSHPDTNKKYDDMMNAYSWLINLAQNKSCTYEGVEDFDNYLMTILNSKLSYLNYKRSIVHSHNQLIRTPVSKDSIPKVVERLGDDYIDFYKYLVGGNDDIEPICQELGISNDQGLIMRDQLYQILVRSGRQMLVLPKKFHVTTFDPQLHEKLDAHGKKKQEKQDQLIEEIIKFIKSIIPRLTNDERRFIQAYWSGKTVNQLFDSWSKMGLGILDRLNINKPKDMYMVIKSIIRKAVKLGKNDFSKIIKKYEINDELSMPRMTQFMAVYIEFLDNEK